MKSFKNAQSIIEYICVTMVFAAIGIGGFILANRAAMSRYRGEVATYRAPDTLQGKILNDGVSNAQYKQSADWSEPQEEFNGAAPDSFVNNPNVKPLPAPKDEESEAKLEEFKAQLKELDAQHESDN